MEDSEMLARKKTLLLLSVITANCATLGARADERSFELRYYTNEPGGKEIAAHDYAAAIVAASGAVAIDDPLTALIGSTNLCVAYTMTASFKEAARSCDAAVALARRVDPPSNRRLSTDTESATARALSNRGVLRALRGDVAAAAGDLRAAQKSVGGVQLSARNLAHLESSPAYRERVVLADSAAD
jgi:hypothetical protein